MPGLEHREAERRPAIRERYGAGGEDRQLVLGRAGEHVDHSGTRLGLDLEEELT